MLVGWVGTCDVGFLVWSRRNCGDREDGCLTHLIEVLAISPCALDHTSCVQHEEVNISNLLSQLLPGAGIADVGPHAADIADEVLLRKIKSVLVEVGNGDFHAVFEA